MLEKYVVELKEKQHSLIQKNLDGVISNNILREQLERIDKELMDANAKLLPAPARTKNIGGLLETISDFLKTPEIIWGNSSFQKKQNLQWFVFPNGVLFDGQKFRTTKISSIFKPKDLFLPPLSKVVNYTKKSANNPNITSTKNNQFNQDVLDTLYSEIVALSEILLTQDNAP